MDTKACRKSSPKPQAICSPALREGRTYDCFKCAGMFRGRFANLPGSTPPPPPPLPPPPTVCSGNISDITINLPRAWASSPPSLIRLRTPFRCRAVIEPAACSSAAKEAWVPRPPSGAAVSARVYSTIQFRSTLDASLFDEVFPRSFITISWGGELKGWQIIRRCTGYPSNERVLDLIRRRHRTLTAVHWSAF